MYTYMHVYIHVCCDRADCIARRHHFVREQLDQCTPWPCLTFTDSAAVSGQKCISLAVFDIPRNRCQMPLLAPLVVPFDR